MLQLAGALWSRDQRDASLLCAVTWSAGELFQGQSSENLGRSSTDMFAKISWHLP